jgi:superoxide dismutase, Fe-Mn family
MIKKYKGKIMSLNPRPLPFDAAQTPGISEKLHLSHHQNNYSGAVKRLNAIRSELAAHDFATMPGFTLAGIKREELLAHNSMVLHELYFESLGAAEKSPAMALALAASFGSVERWAQEFFAMAKALGGGSGWVLLTFLPREGRLVNQWAGDHTHIAAGAEPILAMDMYEHAYHMDHGANVGAYIDAFMANIAWDKVYARYQHAVHAVGDALAAKPDALKDSIVIDVRRAGVYEQATTMMPQAHWRDPAQVREWAAELPAGKPVVVYCIYGHEVGRSTAMQLQAHGVNATFLAGGIDEWQKAGNAVVPKA